MRLANRTSSSSVDYLAPAGTPTVDPVTITAVSHADPSKIGTAIVSVTGVSIPLSVSVSPFYAFVPHSTSALQHSAVFVSVTGGSNTAVTWRVQSAVAGQGCGGSACGSVDANGIFTAPNVAPSPNAISITATSEAANTKSASATIAITSGPLARVSPANSCTNDQQINVDGLNTICFNQSSAAVTTGVLAFTRVITANAPGVSIGASGPAAFAGQILNADTYSETTTKPPTQLPPRPPLLKARAPMI